MHIPIKRSQNNKLIAGVLGGLSEHFGWNPAIARVLWVLLSLALTAVGIIGYLVLWLLMENPDY
ncbi:PspC domain-containing protein [Companilactobacillus halodurans]|uniref:PspC domain-containing protein n=1 Tax=Companilactobacillus halodurans TaxID=2584183 RepID=A0A5P0ZRQ6_9LACO|nr:PspC domain-containing protein [Companilactobacillus halodurans]MQS76745.1 PspC domain-containing protein [Companilactobacillus halodurans]MQS97506.1 PspC domain-containing protein [Companilactobacillus halodurans]